MIKDWNDTPNAIKHKNNRKAKIIVETIAFQNLCGSQWCLFETSKIIFSVVWRFCIYMHQDRSLVLHHNFRCFKCLRFHFCLFLYTVKIPFTYWWLSKNGGSPVLTLPKNVNNLLRKKSDSMFIHCKCCFFFQLLGIFWAPKTANICKSDMVTSFKSPSLACQSSQLTLQVITKVLLPFLVEVMDVF